MNAAGTTRLRRYSVVLLSYGLRPRRAPGAGCRVRLHRAVHARVVRRLRVRHKPLPAHIRVPPPPPTHPPQPLTRACTNPHTHTHARTHACTHAHARTHARTHARAHTRASERDWSPHAHRRTRIRRDEAAAECHRGKTRSRRERGTQPEGRMALRPSMLRAAVDRPRAALARCAHAHVHRRYARMYSGVSTYTFVKHITMQTITEAGLRSVYCAVIQWPSPLYSLLYSRVPQSS